MSGTSDRAERGAVDDLWVVDVTAPLSSGRVHEVAADAAARLKLPVEKLLALLENRIGPVTKPLPHASAARVAEVLDLSGADVLLRPADPHDEPADLPEGARADSPTAESPRHASTDPAAPAEMDRSERESPTPSEPVTEPVAKSAPEPTPAPVQEAGDHDGAAESASDSAKAASSSMVPSGSDAAAPISRPGPIAPAAAQPADAEARADRDAPTADAAPPATPDEDGPTIGRPGEPARTRAPSSAARPDAPGTSSTGHDDPWGALDEDDDDAMLGGWRRATVSNRSDPRPPRARTSPAPTRSEPAQPAASGTKEWRPIAERPPVRERHDEEDSSWSYGLRDPFAEADARERTLRRWVLMVALLIASTIFVALQWAYSRPGLGETGVASYQEGLVAYRDGAFVSAARAWTPLAERGDPSAMFMLGWMAEFGQGRPWSNREAASWYRQASERGHPASQLRLADLYRRGLGVSQDPELALQWYLRAAQAGVPRAQREAALLLAHVGRIDEARTWLSRAAEHDLDAAAWWSLAQEADGTTSLSP